VRGFFKTDTTIEHDQLTFRSRVEIAIYDELARRKLLFFPNAAAVLGGAKALKREPDFLICDRGRWGILEVMGDQYHKNAAKDHDRGRRPVRPVLHHRRVPGPARGGG
jgi:hypothetical protein